ncbi:DUF58 domain-containing protein [Psychrosphaera ytuae]|uniref:DUF58 domain-containing protein n=1 Tax=Psychrosphaera ytuae TaxID=2820710 RepID=A0A975DDL2_9GAMM|nr:DUF58 domain-containing protein [Psychrosphaera ytuae]QTH63700.1 DUF58 domain-containing protein [Psychrosphaera ytuae]
MHNQVNLWLQEANTNGTQCQLDELLKYQGFTHLLNTKPSARIKHHLSGQYLAKTKGRGMEFDEARHYQPGDDVRAIDWRVTARTGKTHTKVFKEEKDRPIFILCDLLPSMKFGSQFVYKSVQASHLAALVAWRAKQQGDKVGGLVLTDSQLLEAKPRARQKALLHWLNNLVEGNEQLATNEGNLNEQQACAKFENACSHLRRVAHPGSLIYIISDFLHVNEQARQHLFQLQKHCEINACWVYDPIEQSLPNVVSDDLTVTDGIHHKRLNSLQQITAYNKTAQQFFEQQKSAIQQLNIKWLPVSAGLPLQQQL